MRFLIVAFVAMMAASGAASAQPSTDAQPTVEIGLFGYNVEGTSTSAAWDNEPSLSSTVYANGTLCRVGAGDRTPPPDAAHAWKFSGSIVSKTADEVVLQLRWQRLLDRGQAVAGPVHDVQLTLRKGERVALDSVIPESSACSSATAAFEVRYGPRLWGKTTIVRPGAGADRRPSESASGGAAASGKVAAGPRSPVSLTQVDLWLVHQVPGQPEAVFHQVVRPQQNQAEFAFAPVTITTPSGQANVHVTGSLRVSPSRQLIFFTNRRVSYPGQADSATNTSGAGKIVRDIPSTEEVISFNMPPIRTAGTPAALPDQFSIRFRTSSGRD